MRKLYLLAALTLLGCKNNLENPSIPIVSNNPIQKIFLSYNDSINNSKNEAYRMDYKVSFEEEFKKMIDTLRFDGWEGKYILKEVNPAIIEYYIDFGDFRIRDYASKETNKKKHDYIKELVDGDKIKIYGKPEPLDDFDFPSKSGYSYNFNEIDIFTSSDSIVKITNN